MTPTTVPEHATLRPINRKEAPALAEAAYRGFADLLSTASGPDWGLPTDCAGWTVRDLAGHMVGAMRAAASLRELGRQQREIGRRRKREGGNETDIMTALQIELTADLEPDSLVQQCQELAVPAAKGRAKLPGPVRRMVKFPVEFGATTETWRLGYLLDVILTRDAWLHTVDLARALGVDPPRQDSLDRRIVGDVALEWAGRHGRPVRVELTGPAGGTYEFSGNGAAPPETITMDAIEFARTLSGREAGVGLLSVDVPF